MLSVRSLLFSYKSHLPANWLPSDGLLSLFPPGYSGSISPLKNYVFSRYCQLATNGYGYGPSCGGYFWLMADGQGRWFFGWIYGKSYVSSEYVRQAGFVFKYSVDGQVYGYVDRTHPQVLTRSCNAGTDGIIAKHWPQMFAEPSHAQSAPEASVQGARIFFQLGSAPDPSQVWNGSGYLNLESIPLAGSNVVADGPGSGSTLFHFPTVTPDCYVAAIIAKVVVTALKANMAVVADSDIVKQNVTSSSFPSGLRPSILEYIKTPMCQRVIADSRVIATQVFNLYNGQGSHVSAAKLSSLMTPNQLMASGSAAYAVVTSSNVVPRTVWTDLKALNV